MNTQLVEFFANTPFIKEGKPAVDIISNAPVSHLLDFCYETVALTDARNLAAETSIFAHSASISLGGGRFPCESLACRTQHIDELTQFAALYSEKVYVNNFFKDHVSHLVERRRLNEDIFRQIFADDIQVYLQILPLIEAGIVVPITTPTFCSKHLLNNSLEGDVKNKLDDVFKSLVRQIRDNITITLTKEFEFFVFHIQASSEHFMEHRSVVFRTRTMPSFFRKHPKLMAQINSGKKVKLSKAAMIGSEMSEGIATNLMESIVFELATSQCLNTSFLTNREIDTQLLKDIAGNEKVRDCDQIIERNLTALVPFLVNIKSKDLIKLRKGDEESFILFRNSLQKTITEYKKTSGRNFTKADAKIIYGDILQPELSRLTKKLEKAQKVFVRSTSGSLIGWTAALSLGAFAGFVTGNIVQAAAALGLTKVLADVTEKAVMSSDTESLIRDEDLYFLWKVKRSSQK